MSVSGVSSEFAKRAAQNQALYREVNERIEELGEGHGFSLLDFVCECAIETCAQRIALSVGEYEALRAMPTCFAVAPDEAHVVPGVERVVERSARYWVVEKVGVAGELAEALDPRT